MASTVRFLGRCKRCKVTRRVAPTIERECLQIHAFKQKIVYLYTYDDVERKLGDSYGWTVRCAACGVGVMTFRKIAAKLTDEPCSPRCTHARGPNCNCACAGENHGNAYGEAPARVSS